MRARRAQPAARAGAALYTPVRLPHPRLVPPMARKPRPELLALLDRCKDRPEDDAPRLVLADWPDDHGDEHDRARARLIRLQLSRPHVMDEPAWGEHSDREHELLQSDAARAWCEPFAPLAGKDSHWGHHRGLVRVRVPQKALAARGAKRLADSEAWAWVEELTLDGHQGDVLPEVFASPLLDTIAALKLNEFRFWGEGVEHLAGCERLGRLRSLCPYGA